MKKKLSLMGIALVLIALVYQGTMAVFQETTNINTKVSAAKLGVTLIQNGVALDDAANTEVFDKALPGAEFDYDVKVNNAKNKDVYVRVALTKYWVDEAGEKVVDADARFIQLLSAWTDWIVIDDAANSNNEVVYAYYKKVLAPGETTTSLLETLGCKKELNDQAYANYKIKVDVEVDAIQSVGARDAIMSEWGMDVTFDGNKNILTVSE